MALLKPRILRWATPVIFVAAVILAAPVWLQALGEFLVSAQQPFKAGMIVVLAGDDHGNRILKAGELARQGWAPKILVSGPDCCYGRHEDDIAIPFAVAHGYPEAWFIPFPIKGTSTRAEAREVVSELNRLHVDKFIIVTSNYHTRRATNIYRELVATDRFRVVEAKDWAFSPESWWRSREGQKQAFIEWAKTLANSVGL